MRLRREGSRRSTSGIRGVRGLPTKRRAHLCFLLRTCPNFPSHREGSMMRRCCTVCFWPPLCLARRTMPSSKSIVAIAFAVLLILVTVVPALAFGSCNTWSLTSTYFDLPDEGIAILYVPLASLPLSRRERKFVFDFQPVPLLQCLFLYPRRFSHGSSCWSSQQSHLIRIELQVLFHSSSCSMAERKVSNLPVLR